MSVLGRLEALRDIQRKGSVDYETLNLAISHIESQDERIRELEGRLDAIRHELDHFDHDNLNKLCEDLAFVWAGGKLT